MILDLIFDFCEAEFSIFSPYVLLKFFIKEINYTVSHIFFWISWISTILSIRFYYCKYLSVISKGLVNQTLISENSNLKFFKSISFERFISSN